MFVPLLRAPNPATEASVGVATEGGATTVPTTVIICEDSPLLLPVAVSVTVSVKVPTCAVDSDTVGLAEAPAPRPLNEARPELMKAEMLPLSVKLPAIRSAGPVAALATARVAVGATVAPCSTVPRFRT